MVEQFGISFQAIGPEIVLTSGAVLILLAEVTLNPGEKIHGVITGFTLAVAGLLAFDQWRDAALPDQAYAGMVVVDRPAVLISFILLATAALGVAAGWRTLVEMGRRSAESLALILVSVAGFMFMTSSLHLMMTFLGLEIGSISLYVLTGIARHDRRGDEAALKYFLLGSFASAIFVYGVALLFSATGSLTLAGMRQFLSSTVLFDTGVLSIGLSLVVVGLLFKVSAAPFHFWAPDVYQGAPAGLTGFMAATAKVAGFATLARLLIAGFPSTDIWVVPVSAVAALSILVGTVLAVVQDDLRRVLAYSGVAHAGFLLMAVGAGRFGTDELWFYLAVYVVQVIAAFAVVAAVSGASSSASPLDAYRGLARRSPMMSATLTVMMLAMAGVPLTSGFVAKFGVFTVAWEHDLAWLVVLGLVASVVAFFFYLRVVVEMYMKEPADAPGATVAAPAVPLGTKWVLTLATLVTVGLGVYPAPLLDLVTRAFGN